MGGVGLVKLSRDGGLGSQLNEVAQLHSLPVRYEYKVERQPKVPQNFLSPLFQQMSDLEHEESQAGPSTPIDISEHASSSLDESVPVKRGRGRPRKQIAATPAPTVIAPSITSAGPQQPEQQPEEQQIEETPKKGRGRPRNAPLFSVTTTSNTVHIPDYIAKRIKVFPIIPSVDEWFGERLTQDQQSMYQQLMKARFTSTEKYPVDFEILWRTLRYSQKHVAAELLLGRFVRNVDFISLSRHTSVCNTSLSSKYITVTS